MDERKNKLKSYNKSYYELNKEKLKEKRKERYYKNADKERASAKSRYIKRKHLKIEQDNILNVNGTTEG
jgi:hypothetical protein